MTFTRVMDINSRPKNIHIWNTYTGVTIEFVCLVKKSNMPDVNDLHKFYEANVPEYKRRHLKEVTRFFVGEMGLGITKPIKKALTNFDNLKQFVSIDWFGWDEIRVKRFTTIKNKPAKKRKQDYGKCTCGGFMVKRQNRETKEYFLGCSTYPKCRNTKPLME